MRFVGIDIAAEQHTVAVVDESGAVLLRATPVTEDSIGYGKLLELQTAACIMAETGNPARFHSLAALASYVGVIPRLHESGKRKKTKTGPMMPLGNARLRRVLWMPALSAIRANPWLRAYYQRLRSAGKLPKVALVAVIRKLLAAVYSVARHRRRFTLPPVFPPLAGGAVAVAS